ncbi:MAG: DUF1361 domain-containing protein [Chloroflexi bacterium]|nr:DUF1361 domain-containing protein [Chloroflexota bacterium]
MKQWLKLHGNGVLVILLLFVASMFSTGLILIREQFNGYFEYGFMVWNLILAWVPLFFSLVVYFWQKRPFLRNIAAFLWLLFMPNTLYLVTDIIHLSLHSSVPYWYDLLMLFSFAICGILLGFVSLFLMHTLVARRYGQRVGWSFVMLILSLSSYGIYIGRFRRWNSWDLFVHPGRLLRDIFVTLFHPDVMGETYAASVMFTAVFGFGYFMALSLSALMRTQAATLKE